MKPHPWTGRRVAINGAPATVDAVTDGTLFATRDDGTLLAINPSTAHIAHLDAAPPNREPPAPAPRPVTDHDRAIVATLGEAISGTGTIALPDILAARDLHGLPPLPHTGAQHARAAWASIAHLADVSIPTDYGTVTIGPRCKVNGRTCARITVTPATT